MDIRPLALSSGFQMSPSNWCHQSVKIFSVSVMQHLQGTLNLFTVVASLTLNFLDLLEPSWLSERTGEPTKCVCKTLNRKCEKESSLLLCCGVLLFVTLICIFLSAASHFPRNSRADNIYPNFPIKYDIDCRLIIHGLIFFSDQEGTGKVLVNHGTAA